MGSPLNIYPAQFVLVLSVAVGSDVFDGGVEIQTEWALALLIAQVKKKSVIGWGCWAYWCTTSAIQPMHGQVLSILKEDHMWQHTPRDNSMVNEHKQE